MIIIWKRDGALIVELKDGSSKVITNGANEIPNEEWEGVQGLANALKPHIDAGNLIVKGEFKVDKVKVNVPLYTKQGVEIKESVEVLAKDGKGTGQFKEQPKTKEVDATDVTVKTGKAFKDLSANEQVELVKACSSTTQLEDWKKGTSKEALRKEILNRIEEIQNPKED